MNPHDEIVRMTQGRNPQDEVVVLSVPEDPLFLQQQSPSSATTSSSRTSTSVLRNTTTTTKKTTASSSTKKATLHPWRADVHYHSHRRKPKKKKAPPPLVFPKPSSHQMMTMIVEEEEEQQQQQQEEDNEEEECARSIPTDEEKEQPQRVWCACPDASMHLVACQQQQDLLRELHQTLAHRYVGHLETIESIGLGLEMSPQKRYYCSNNFWSEEERFQQRQMQYVLREMHQTHLPKRRILSEFVPPPPKETTRTTTSTASSSSSSRSHPNQKQTATTTTASSIEELRELHKIVLQEMRALIFPHLPLEFHYVIEANGTMPKEQEQTAARNQEQSAAAAAAKVVVPTVNRQEIQASLKAFDQLLVSRRPTNETEWDEYTVEDSVAPQQQLQEQEQQHSAAAPTRKLPDDDEWTEYTVEESVVSGNNQQQQQQARLDTILASKSLATTIAGQGAPEQQVIGAPDDDEWTEYTVEEESVAHEQQARLDAILASKASMVDVVPARIAVTGQQQQQQNEVHSEMHDDEWTEYTVEESVNEEQQRQARLSAILASKNVVVHAPAGAAVVTEPQSPPAGPARHAIQDDEWTEYTVEETVADEQEERLNAILANKSNVHSQNLTPVSPVDNVEGYATCEEDSQLQDEMNALAMPSFTTSESQEDEELEDDDDEYTEITMLEEEDHTIAEPITSPISLGRGTFAPRQQPEQPSSKNSNHYDGEEEDGFTIHLQMSPSPRKMDSITDETDALSDDESTAYNSAREDHGSNSAPGSPLSASSSSSSRHTAQLLRQDVWSVDSETVQAALEELSQQAGQGSAQRATIVRYGGLLAITRAMQAHRSHVGIQMAACDCLTQMARDAENRLAIGQVGGLEAVIVAMQVHSADLKIHQAACAALARLSQDGAANQIHLTGAVDTLTKSMGTFRYHPKIQQYAFRALANLCLEDSQRLRELSQSGGMTAMTDALQRPWESSSEKHEAISTLSILLRSLAANDS